MAKGIMTVLFERCKGCGLCTTVCPVNIVALQKKRRNSKGYFTSECTDTEKCIGCGMCATICPDCAIRVEKLETGGSPSQEQNPKEAKAKE